MIRAIVVDDERPALRKLEKLLENSGLAEVTGVFFKPAEAMEFLKENKADAVFLDIEMPKMNGIELAGQILDLQGNVAVVFVTAYNQYAAEAFRLNALDYLLKPVTAERLNETLRRIIEEKEIAIPSEGVAVQCFGKFTVKAGTEEIRFRTEKSEELLAYLIDSRGLFLSRNKILDSLWESFEGDRAVSHFNTTLYYIKKALLPYGVNITILYDRGSYRLDTESVNCDYLKFCAFGKKNETAASENIMEFEETAALYSGEYLSGWDCSWAAGKRLLLEEQYIGMLLKIAEYYRNTGCYQKAAKWLKDGLQCELLHRELNYRLIEILKLSNERILAVKYYDLYRDGLAKKLKLEPDAAFKKLLGQP